MEHRIVNVLVVIVMEHLQFHLIVQYAIKQIIAHSAIIKVKLPIQQLAMIVLAMIIGEEANANSVTLRVLVEELQILIVHNVIAQENTLWHQIVLFVL
jgi:hypothetical protein